MSNHILVLVKVNSVWGIVFSTTSLGTEPVTYLGFTVSVDKVFPSPDLTANPLPHTNSGLPSETPHVC